MADLLNTSVSGLKAFQRALDTTGHNISNAGTEGYSRQTVSMATREPQPYSNGFVGSGVQVTSVERVYDQFLVGELRSSTSAHAQADTYYDFAQQMDNIVADADSGLTPSLSSFFSAVQDVADNPTSTEARQVMLSEADSLADRFHYLDDRFQELEERVNGELDQAVADINSLSGVIADLNQDIVFAQGRTGQPPNDMLDQRDQAILELSEYVDVKTVSQDDGSVNLFIGQGQPLVVGTNANTLSISEGEYSGSGDRQITLGTTPITDYFSGGKVEGLLDFRNEVLDPARNTLGQTAIGLGEAFNEQHGQGLDLYGDLGGEFFSYGEPETLAAAGNSAVGEPLVTVEDATKLTAMEYTLQYDDSDSSWKLYDQNGSEVTDPATHGLSIDTTGISSAAAGDKFLIRPTHNGAGTIDTEISDTSRIAAASPLRAEAAVDGNGVPSNSGDATISGLAVEPTADTDLDSVLTSGDIELTYDSSEPGFTLTVNGTNTGEVISYDPTTDSGGKRFDLGDELNDQDYAGITFTLAGTPADGDRFTIEKNSNAPGDNGNALALAGLESEKLLNNSQASIQDNYGRMVADIGTKTRQAETNTNAQEQRLQQASDARESVSGVNLDEEAARLLEFQQAYQAVAKTIQTADEMFQTLLNAV